VEIVGVRGAEARNFALRLSPGGGGSRMRVCDASDGGELAIQNHVGGQIGGRAQGTLDNFAVQIRDHQVLGFHLVVRYTLA